MKKFIIYHFLLVLKGIGIGAANVIPGVSGGTIALLTGVFEKLIHSLKSLDFKALKLLFTGRFTEFEKHLNLFFLVAVFSGLGIGVVTLARLLDYSFKNYEIYTWSFFFGLILASIYYVAKTIERWNMGTILFLIIGTAIATTLTFMNPAVENANFFYLVLCGIVAVCSMILPGISGSFVLILMGNYKLVMIDAVNNLDFMVMVPIAAGAVLGLFLFSHFLSWLFSKWRNFTMATLTGFIIGSLGILWPWKEKIYKLNEFGNEILSSRGLPIIEGYNHYLPNFFSQQVIIAMLIMLAGFFTIWALERTVPQKDVNL
ncbi:MAG TPA: DUF368 domain-containing protein [Bacteroidales bacterium]|nr:DUF368 domain-containing protein [Bacteroidales bacterium]